MASEAAVLGTPAIFVSPTGRGYTHVQEHTYGLVSNFRDTEQGKALDAVTELVRRTYPKDHWLKRRQRLLEDTIDVTGWLVRLVERFGETRNADVAADWALREAKSEGRLAG
jgi:predicted glycosyltransferase